MNRKSISTEERIHQLQQSIEQLRGLLHAYIEQNLIRHFLENKTPAVVKPVAADQVKLQWTGTVVDFSLLVYALQGVGVVNNGKAEIKSMMTGLGNLFNIDPGNYSSTFQEFLERKKGFTNITDRMVDAIRKKINNSLNN